MNVTHHPLAEAYLADLYRALAGRDPGEQADTLAAVREHLDEAFAGVSSDIEAHRVLDGLGPAEAIADGVAPGTAGLDRLALVAAIGSLRTPGRPRWLAVAVLVLVPLTLILGLPAWLLLASSTGAGPLVRV